MKLQCTSTFGNFKWTAEADVTEEQAAILANAGLLQVLQRSPASRAEKRMANGGKGYEKRPDKFERSSIEYSELAGKVLAGELGSEVEIAEGMTISPTVSVSFHEIGGSALPKFVEEKQIVSRHVAKGDLAEWASATVKFSGDTVDHDGNPTTDFLQAVKAYKTARLSAI